MKDNDFLIVIGLFAGIGVGVCVFGLGLGKLPSDAWAFAGGVLGAIVTVYGALSISRSDARRRDQQAAEQTATRRAEMQQALNRRIDAARAVLGIDLSTISDYCDACAIALRLFPHNVDVQAHVQRIKGDQLDPQVILRLQNLVELLDGNEAAQIVSMMHCYQVQLARMRNLVQRSARTNISRLDILPTLGKTIELKRRALEAFGFARKESETIPTPPYNVTLDSVLLSMELFDWLRKHEKTMLQSELNKICPPISDDFGEITITGHEPHRTE